MEHFFGWRWTTKVSSRQSFLFDPGCRCQFLCWSIICQFLRLRIPWDCRSCTWRRSFWFVWNTCSALEPSAALLSLARQEHSLESVCQWCAEHCWWYWLQWLAWFPWNERCFADPRQGSAWSRHISGTALCIAADQSAEHHASSSQWSASISSSCLTRKLLRLAPDVSSTMVNSGSNWLLLCAFFCWWLGTSVLSFLQIEIATVSNSETQPKTVAEEILRLVSEWRNWKAQTVWHRLWSAWFWPFPMVCPADTYIALSYSSLQAHTQYLVSISQSPVQSSSAPAQYATSSTSPFWNSSCRIQQSWKRRDPSWNKEYLPSIILSSSNWKLSSS